MQMWDGPLSSWYHWPNNMLFNITLLGLVLSVTRTWVVLWGKRKDQRYAAAQAINITIFALTALASTRLIYIALAEMRWLKTIEDSARYRQEMWLMLVGAIGIPALATLCGACLIYLFYRQHERQEAKA